LSKRGDSGLLKLHIHTGEVGWITIEKSTFLKYHEVYVVTPAILSNRTTWRKSFSILLKREKKR